MTAKRAGAWLVHLYTGLGGILAFLTLEAICERDHRRAFLLLLLAFVVDGTDGYWARRLEVREILPWIDGELLDLVIDFLTYAVLPLFLLWTAGLLPTPPALWAALILVASMFDFAKLHAFKAQGVYTGLPALWNAYAFYVYHYRPGELVQAAAIVALLVATFLPLPFIHVSSFPRFRRLHLALFAGWLLVWALVSQGLVARPRLWLGLSWLFPAFYLTASALFARHPKAAGET